MSSCCFENENFDFGTILKECATNTEKKSTPDNKTALLITPRDRFIGTELLRQRISLCISVVTLLCVLCTKVLCNSGRTALLCVI